MLDRSYIIPLRREYMKVPKYRRAKKAVRAVREFMQRHMKSDEILLGPKLNMAIWARGIKNPPHHIKVTAIKNDEGEVRVELSGFEFKKKEIKEKAPEGLAGKIQEKLGTAPKKKEEPKSKTADKPEEKKAEPKKGDATPTDKPKEAKPAVEAKKEAKPTDKPEEKKADAETPAKETAPKAKPADKK